MTFWVGAATISGRHTAVPLIVRMRLQSHEGLRYRQFHLRTGRRVIEDASRAPLYRLRASGRLDALGIPDRPLRLTWSVSPSANLGGSTEFLVEVAAGPDQFGSDLSWATTTRRTSIGYDGPALGSRARRWWQVWADSDASGVHSELAWFETGLTEAADWRARWIAAPRSPFPRESFDPAPYLRREFSVAEWDRPRLYITAFGLYRVWLNGVELTANARLRPGWTDYRQRVLHQTYDCADHLVSGRNVLAAVLAKGWYAGRLGLLREPALYGDRPALLAQLESHPGECAVVTDESWQTGHGAIQASDLLRGETQDLRQEPHGWHAPGFAGEGWKSAEIVEAPDGLIIQPQPNDSIDIHTELPGRLVRAHARGPAVFDFGQNLVGWTRLRARYLPSVELIVRHGEILTPENLVYRDNLRGAFQSDSFTVPDEGPHELEPAFGMHGFRYAEVWGLPSAAPFGNQELLPDTEITAVAYTGLPQVVGDFRCSDDRLNTLVNAIEYTVRDNFLEVATDCPQRDERMGWLADASVIAPTAAYLLDLEAFLIKFTQDGADGQGKDGVIRNYVPVVPPADLRPGAPGWSDGYIRLIHLLADRYGALDIADRLFASMTRYLDFVDRGNPDGLRINDVGADFGDWLSLPDREGLAFHRGYEYTGAYSTSPHAVVDTAHTYRSFRQTADVAGWLGRDDERDRLSERAEQIRTAYRAAFLADDGTIHGETQTVYAQAVGFGLLEGQDAQRAADRLAALIESTGHLTTGIHGVQHLLPVLTAHGYADSADRLLFSDAMPGWLHMIRSGATTIWEKWDGIGADGRLSTAEMNSFNHCALGAVGQFLFESVAGLRAADTGRTGRIVVHSHYPRALQWVQARHETPVGLARSRWSRDGDLIEHQVDVPGVTAAEFSVPAGSLIRSSSGEALGERITLQPGRHTLIVEETRRP